MADKSGLFEKVRQAFIFLVSKEYRNILNARCEFCKSCNIKADNKNSVVSNYEGDTYITYTAGYTCQNCFANSTAKQVWVKDEFVL